MPWESDAQKTSWGNVNPFKSQQDGGFCRMLHSMSWLDIVGDEELFTKEKGWGRKQGLLLSTIWKTLQPDAWWFRQKPEVSTFDLQTVRETKKQSTTGSTQGNGRKGEKTEEERSERRGEKRGSLVKGFLRPKSPQNARQAGSGACHVCNQHFATIPQDPGNRQKCRQTDIYMQQGRKAGLISMETCRQTGSMNRENRTKVQNTSASVKKHSIACFKYSLWHTNTGGIYFILYAFILKATYFSTCTLHGLNFIGI